MVDQSERAALFFCFFLFFPSNFSFGFFFNVLIQFLKKTCRSLRFGIGHFKNRVFLCFWFDFFWFQVRLCPLPSFFFIKFSFFLSLSLFIRSGFPILPQWSELRSFFVLFFFCFFQVSFLFNELSFARFYRWFRSLVRWEFWFYLVFFCFDFWFVFF